MIQIAPYEPAVRVLLIQGSRKLTKIIRVVSNLLAIASDSNSFSVPWSRVSSLATLYRMVTRTVTFSIETKCVH